MLKCECEQFFFLVNQMQTSGVYLEAIINKKEKNDKGWVH